jgi:hypothetical protein
MNEKQEQISEDWRDEISDSTSAALKVADGESKTFVFLNEGEKRTHQDYGTSIVFQVEYEGETMSFYVRENNYALLKQIKELGKLTGKAATISRTGSKKSDTRYELTEVQKLK